MEEVEFAKETFQIHYDGKQDVQGQSLRRLLSPLFSFHFLVLLTSPPSLATVESLYQKDSIFTMNGKTHRGPKEIKEALVTGIKAEKIKHRITSMDCHTLANLLVILITGEISVDDGNPLKFTETFILVQTPSKSFAIQSDIFALNYG